MTSRDNLVGRQFGRLLVLEEAPTELRCHPRHSSWFCACSCGTFSVVDRANLVSGGTVSCGCVRRERVRPKSMVQHAPHALPNGASDPLPAFYGMRSGIGKDKGIRS